MKLSKILKLNEKLELVSWDEYAKLVAKAYMDAPDYEEEAVPSFEAMKAACERYFKILQSKVKVEFVDGDPYSDADQMRKEVGSTKALKIMKDFSDHPFFSREDIWKSRAVHDWFTHITAGQPFSLQGELSAYNQHLKMFPKAAWPALFTEIVGQVCTKEVIGEFQKQKMCLLKGFDYEKVGRVDGMLIKDKKLVPAS